MPKRFKRTIEDFTCLVCGRFVKGNGYTNHCPYCLSSRHVDINPGDRASDCRGIMKAIALETTHGESYLVHQCTRCAHRRRNKVGKNDSFNAILALSNGTLNSYIEHIKNRNPS